MPKLHIKKRFGVAPCELLSSREASWKAKGLYTYIQSKPEDWEFAIERMEASDGKDSTRSGVQELERLGYLMRERVRQNDGTYDVDYTLFEDPNDNPNRGGKPAMVKSSSMAENPTAENPTAENPPYNKDRNTKKELQKKSINIEFETFWEKYENKKGKKAAQRAYEKLDQEERNLAQEALSKHIDYWRKKYGTPGKKKIHTTYIPYPATWLNGRRWEDEIESDITYPTTDTASRNEAKQKELAARKIQQQKQKELEESERRANEYKKSVREAFKALTKEEQLEIKTQAQKECEEINPITKNRYPKVFESMVSSRVIKIFRDRYPLLFDNFQKLC